MFQPDFMPSPRPFSVGAAPRLERSEPLAELPATCKRWEIPVLSLRAKCLASVPEALSPNPLLALRLYPGAPLRPLAPNELLDPVVLYTLACLREWLEPATPPGWMSRAVSGCLGPLIFYVEPASTTAMTTPVLLGSLTDPFAATFSARTAQWAMTGLAGFDPPRDQGRLFGPDPSSYGYHGARFRARLAAIDSHLAGIGTVAVARDLVTLLRHGRQGDTGDPSRADPHRYAIHRLPGVLARLLADRGPLSGESIVDLIRAVLGAEGTLRTPLYDTPDAIAREIRRWSATIDFLLGRRWSLLSAGQTEEERVADARWAAELGIHHHRVDDASHVDVDEDRSRLGWRGTKYPCYMRLPKGRPTAVELPTTLVDSSLILLLPFAVANRIVRHLVSPVPPVVQPNRGVTHAVPGTRWAAYRLPQILPSYRRAVWSRVVRPNARVTLPDDPDGTSVRELPAPPDTFEIIGQPFERTHWRDLRPRQHRARRVGSGPAVEGGGPRSPRSLQGATGGSPAVVNVRRNADDKRRRDRERYWSLRARGQTVGYHLYSSAWIAPPIGLSYGFSETREFFTSGYSPGPENVNIGCLPRVLPPYMPNGVADRLLSVLPDPRSTPRWEHPDAPHLYLWTDLRPRSSGRTVGVESLAQRLVLHLGVRSSYAAANGTVDGDGEPGELLDHDLPELPLEPSLWVTGLRLWWDRHIPTETRTTMPSSGPLRVRLAKRAFHMRLLIPKVRDVDGALYPLIAGAAPWCPFLPPWIGPGALLIPHRDAFDDRRRKPARARDVSHGSPLPTPGTPHPTPGAPIHAP